MFLYSVLLKCSTHEFETGVITCRCVNSKICLGVVYSLTNRILNKIKIVPSNYICEQKINCCSFSNNISANNKGNGTQQ